MNTRKNNDTNVTVLLERIRVDEDDQARSQLLDVIHATLLQMARGKMRGERVDHTLGASGLVNEAYIRLSKGLASNQHRRALFGAAARAMQEILIDHARKRNARKRLGQQQREPLDDVLDEGITLASIQKKVMDSGAKAFYSAVLADKTIGKPKPFQADFVGLTLPNRYVFGFGMDIQGAWRNLPAIYAIKD